MALVRQTQTDVSSGTEHIQSTATADCGYDALVHAIEPYVWDSHHADSHPLGEFQAKGIPVLDLHELAAGKLSIGYSGLCVVGFYSVVWNSIFCALVTRREASRISSDTRLPCSS